MNKNTSVKLDPNKRYKFKSKEKCREIADYHYYHNINSPGWLSSMDKFCDTEVYMNRIPRYTARGCFRYRYYDDPDLEYTFHSDWVEEIPEIEEIIPEEIPQITTKEKIRNILTNFMNNNTTPEFDLDRLASEVDDLFQVKFEKSIGELERDSATVAINFKKSLDQKIEEVSTAVEGIINVNLDTVIAEIQRGRTIIQINRGTQVSEVSIEQGAHPEFENVTRSIALTNKAMLVGPAGTGKTYMVEQIANKLNLPFYKYSCSRDSSVHDLLGYKQPRSEEYLQTAFLNAYENGGVFLVDEYDAMSGDMALFFNGVADNSKFLSIPHRDAKPQAVKHKDFYLIMCGNTYGKGSTEYSGRDFQDLALMDRFRMCRHFIGYNDALEKTFLGAEYQFGMDLRQELEDRGSYLSTRNIEDVASLFSCDVPRTYVLGMLLQDMDEGDKKKVTKTLVDKYGATFKTN